MINCRLILYFSLTRNIETHGEMATMYARKAKYKGSARDASVAT